MAKHTPGSRLPHPPKLSRKDYEQDLRALQIELVKAQSWVQETGHKLMVLVEGRDTAGKGGTIKRFQEHLNPRVSRTVALAAPSDRERTQYYFQRYLVHLPSGGEIVFFDRSWYNRAGVEPVMGFCSPQEAKDFLRAAPRVELGLVEADIQIVKLYLALNPEEQKRRLDARRDDPLKVWKLSAVDEEAQERWHDYTRAQNRMLLVTHTIWAPWTVVNANDKRTAHVEAIRAVLDRLDYPGKDPGVARAPDPAIAAAPLEHWPDLTDDV